MKRFFFFSLLCIVLFASCANTGSLPRRMDNFVAETEASVDYMTLEDWEMSATQYEVLIEEFVENFDYYTPEEKRAVYQAIGRYNGLLAKAGLEELEVEVNQALKTVSMVLEELPGALNGLLEGFKSGLE